MQIILAFQSTHPARGATKRATTLFSLSSNFNPRTPRGVRLLPSGQWRYVPGDFNPRTPRGVRLSGSASRRGCRRNFNPRTPRGVRLNGQREWLWEGQFQSTHPARGATICLLWVRMKKPFQSTHPARGATWRSSRLRRPESDFNPRTPRGVRPPALSQHKGGKQFQSTHPARGATPGSRYDRPHGVISIHAPREGCD